MVGFIKIGHFYMYILGITIVHILKLFVSLQLVILTLGAVV